MAKSHFERWCDLFQPLANHLVKTEVAEGCLFETYGPELEHVRAVARAQPDRVWTMVSGDSGKWYISQGYHLVNRIGYLITEREYDASNPKHQPFFSRDTFYA